MPELCGRLGFVILAVAALAPDGWDVSRMLRRVNSLAVRFPSHPVQRFRACRDLAGELVVGSTRTCLREGKPRLILYSPFWDVDQRKPETIDGLIMAVD